MADVTKLGDSTLYGCRGDCKINWFPEIAIGAYASTILSQSRYKDFLRPLIPYATQLTNAHLLIQKLVSSMS